MRRCDGACVGAGGKLQGRGLRIRVRVRVRVRIWVRVRVKVRVSVRVSIQARVEVLGHCGALWDMLISLRGNVHIWPYPNAFTLVWQSFIGARDVHHLISLLRVPTRG